jgi:hypothetical protein
MTLLLSDIDVDDFKDLFFRDFDYAIRSGQTTSIYECQLEYIMDADITRAFSEATMNFNPSIWPTDEALKIAYLYLTAHYMVNDLQSAEQGTGSSGNFPVSSRGVGPISESYAIPEWMMRDPNIAYFATTRYGQKYLSLVKPLLIGNAVVYEGATTFR